MQVVCAVIAVLSVTNFVGSAAASSVHESPYCASSDPSHTKLALPAGSSQHPKQSQPFGVSGPQNAWQVADCEPSSSAQVAVVPVVLALGSYPQPAPSCVSG